MRPRRRPGAHGRLRAARAADRRRGGSNDEIPSAPCLHARELGTGRVGRGRRIAQNVRVDDHLGAGQVRVPAVRPGEAEPTKRKRARVRRIVERRDKHVPAVPRAARAPKVLEHSACVWRAER